jgi:phage terminase large subunit
MIYRTSTYYLIKRIKKKIKNIQGGQGAGKNISICQILIEKANEKKRLITVMTDTYPNLRDGAITDFKNQFHASDLDWEEAFNKSESNLTIGESVIQFRHISDARGNSGKSKRRDILYINEANKIGWNVASTYIGRTHEDVYIDYNPDFEFWAHTQVPKLVDADGESISEQIIVTYKDNEMCPQGEVDYIESRRDDEQWFRVYGAGLVGTYSDRQIYPFSVIDSIPETAIRIPSGMDFGKSPDPCVLLDYYIDDYDLIIDQRFIKNNLQPQKFEGVDVMSVVDMMEEVEHDKRVMIIGDSSGKTELTDLAKHKYIVKAVKKPAGSVLDGMKKLRAYNIKITKQSVETIHSFSQFLYDEDSNGKIIPGAPKAHEPDVIASSRYVVMGRPWWEYLVPKPVKSA